MTSILALGKDTTAVTSRHANPQRTSSTNIFGRRWSPSLLELDARIPSEIEAISPAVEQLMQIIETSSSFVGDKFALELALREALNNAVVHGNRMDSGKFVELHCHCDRRRGIRLIIKDQGNGFDPNVLSDPLGAEGLTAEHGRGIYLMKLLMDSVSFERGGTEVHIWKASKKFVNCEAVSPQRADAKKNKI